MRCFRRNFLYAWQKPKSEAKKILEERGKAIMKRVTRRFAALLISILVVINTCMGGVELSVSAATDTTTYDVTVTYYQTQARSMLEYVNDFRTGDDAWYWNSDNETKTTCSNLSELVYDYELEKAAMQRAAEIAVYWSHTRPNGESCFTAFSDNSYVYTTSGENIGAASYLSMYNMFVSWQEEDEDYSDQGHRRNMLSSSFNRIAIACVKCNGYYYWVMELANSSMTNTETEVLDEEKTVSIEILDSLVTDVSVSISVSSYTLFEEPTSTSYVAKLFSANTAEVPTVTAELTVDGTWPSSKTISTTPDVTWESSDEDIITVSDSAITVVASGKTYITAEIFGTTYTVPVYVYTQPTFSWSTDFTTCTAVFTCGSTIKEIDCTIGNTASTSPTCTESGSNEYTATCEFGDCTFTDVVYEEIEATGHTWDDGEVTQVATCTDAGQITYTCETCGETKTEEIPATGHSLDYVSPTAATCTEDGNTAYYVCTSCGKYFSDADGENEIEEDDWIIEATGHSWDSGEVTTEPTCTSTGVRTYTCTECGETKTRVIAKTSHNIILVEDANDPTCTEEGNIAYYMCTSCGTYFADADGDEEIEEDDWIIDATGHSWDDGEVTTEPTCTDSGIMTYTCTVCGETTSELISATGHSWTTSEITLAPTCTETGILTYTCGVCGKEMTGIIAASGHEMTCTEATVASCTEDGNSEYYKCDVCGKYFSDADGENEIEEGDWVIPATGHSYDEGVITTEPTCTEAGSITYTCEYCGETITEELDATGHDMYYKRASAATCTEDGNTRYYYCATCGKYFSDSAGKYEIEEDSWIIEATGHSWDDGVITIEPTADEDGIKVYTCSTCGETLEKEITISGHEHTYNASSWVWIIDGDDYEGELTLVCTDCEKEVTKEAEVTAEVVSEATCTEDGKITYTATVSYEGTEFVKTISRTIEATGHTFGNPVCTLSDDKTTITAVFTCSECGYEEIFETEITGETTKTATETEDGVITYTATVEIDGVEYTVSVEEVIEAGSTDSEDNSGSGDSSGTDGSSSGSSNGSSTGSSSGTGTGSTSTGTSTGTNTGSTSTGNTSTGNTSTGSTGTNSGSTDASASIGVGSVYTVGNFTYKITKISTGSNGTVTVIGTVKDKKKVTIPATVKIEGKTYKVTAIAKGTFKGDTKLTTLVIGSNVTTIGANAFAGCAKLKKVTIGAKVKTIGKKAFYNCKSLKSIKIKSKLLTSSSVGKKAFSKVKATVKIKVPKAKKKAYKKMLYKKGVSKKATIS